jgi:hypothetical protein
MLTYADVAAHRKHGVVVRFLPPPRHAYNGNGGGPGTHFTCVASTKVQILTPEELQLQARNLSEFKTGELSMIMWACAKYRHPSDLLYPLVSREFVRYFFFSKRNWVCAKYGHASNVLYPLVPREFFLHQARAASVHASGACELGVGPHLLRRQASQPHRLRLRCSHQVRTVSHVC